MIATMASIVCVFILLISLGYPNLLFPAVSGHQPLIENFSGSLTSMNTEDDVNSSTHLTSDYIRTVEAEYNRVVRMLERRKQRRTIQTIRASGWSQTVRGRQLVRQYQFDLPASDQELIYMKLRVTGPSPPVEHTYPVEVYYLTGPDGKTRRRLHSRMNAQHQKTHVDFKLFNGVQLRGFKRLDRNIQVEIIFNDYNENPVSKFQAELADVLLRFEYLARNRTKRDSSSDLDTGCPRNDGSCCKLPITVNFADVGLPPIFRPQQFETHQCIGGCPHSMMDEIGVNDVAMVRSNLHQLQPSIHPPPCCVPSQFADIPIITYKKEEGELAELEVRILNNFAVEECKCA